VLARKPRVEFEGAFYHVIARGNQRRSIFSNDRDREAYLGRIERYRKRYDFIVYGYVLMSNHVHLLIQTRKVPLSKIMQGIQGGFTQRYNRLHRTTGHLFQGRFKAILCDRDAYLLELVRYIHLNPARIRQPQDPWKYRWSSHRAYLGGWTAVEVNSEEVLAQLGPTKTEHGGRMSVLRHVGSDVDGVRSCNDTRVFRGAWDQTFTSGAGLAPLPQVSLSTHLSINNSGLGIDLLVMSLQQFASGRSLDPWPRAGTSRRGGDRLSNN
jgi:REP element-mobilizing transposase RayT